MFRIGYLPYKLKSSFPNQSFAHIIHCKFPLFFIEDKKSSVNGFSLNKTCYSQVILNQKKYGFDYIISKYEEDLSYKFLYYKVDLHFLYKNNELIENLIFDEDITIYKHVIKLNDRNTKKIYIHNNINNINNSEIPKTIQILHRDLSQI